MRQSMLAVTGVYLVVMAVCDIRAKKIPLLPGILGIIFVCAGNLILHISWVHWVLGMAIGIALGVIGRVSRGAIGGGDALVYCLTGAYLGFFENLELLFISLMLSSLVSLFLITVRHVGKRYSIPFVPFTALAFGMVMFL